MAVEAVEALTLLQPKAVVARSGRGQAVAAMPLANHRIGHGCCLPLSTGVAPTTCAQEGLVVGTLRLPTPPQTFPCT